MAVKDRSLNHACWNSPADIKQLVLGWIVTEFCPEIQIMLNIKCVDILYALIFVCLISLALLL